MYRDKYARLERERRFLICELPEEIANSSGFSLIEDLYIEDTRLRLRKISDSEGQLIERKLGQKFLPDPSQPEEALMTNIYLDQQEYELLAALKGKPLRKRRLAYPYQERVFSIDMFEGELAGLILCEIELAQEDDSPIELPHFVEQEVTQDPFFTGASLVNAQPAQLKEKLAHVSQA